MLMIGTFKIVFSRAYIDQQLPAMIPEAGTVPQAVACRQDRPLTVRGIVTGD
jgi:hypothetical protein